MGRPYPPPDGRDRRLRRLTPTMNVITRTGRLTNDPARRDTPKGVVAVFRLAADHNRRRLWIDIECWGQIAGTAASHLRQGRHVAVNGELVATTYHDHAGNRRERWYVKAAQLTYLDAPSPTDAPDPTASPIDSGGHAHTNH